MRIAFIYLENVSIGIEPHPLHRKWGESVDAVPVRLEPPRIGPPIQHTLLTDIWLNITTSLPSNFDIYLIENPGLIYAIQKFRHQAPAGKYVFLDTSWRRFGRQAYDFSTHDSLLKRCGDNVDKALDGVLQRHLLQFFDGVISASRLFAESIKGIKNNPPVVVCNPSISTSNWDTLSKVEPDYDSKNALMFGEVRGHKGQDLAAKAWRTVRRHHPEAELHFIGGGTQDLTNESIGVIGHGFVDEPTEYFQRASLAVHPARIDAFPVSTIETMSAGLPTLVSTKTGTRSILGDVTGMAPVDPQPEFIADRVCRYFNLLSNKRKDMGESSREAARQYTRPKQEFKETLGNLIKEI